MNKTILLIILLFCSSLLTTKVFAKAPASWFFSHPDIVNVVLSPNGDAAVVVRIVEGEQQLKMMNFSTDKEYLLLNTQSYSENDTGIQGIVWLDNQYLAVQLSELRAGIEDLLDTKVSRRLLVVDTLNSATNTPNITRVRTKGWLAHPLREEKGHFLYAKSGAYSKIYKLDVSELGSDKKALSKLDKIDGGQFKKSNEVSSVEGYAIRWFFNEAGAVKAVLNYNRERKVDLTIFQSDGKKSVVKTWDLDKNNKRDNKKQLEDTDQTLIPIAITSDENTFYCLDFSEEEERSVYKVNFTSGEKTLVYETDSYRIVDLILSEEHELRGIEVVKDGEISYEYIDGEEKNRDFVEKESSDQLFSYFDRSVDGSEFILYTEGHDISGEFYYVDEKKSLKQIVGHIRPTLKDKLDSELVEGFITVKELQIPYLLSIPRKIRQSNYPLIVMPHGGPIGVFDTRYYDRQTQYFAANGYAVLRVNFRGSSGHSDELKEAGKREWGGKMLLDIYEATLQVIKRPDIDEQRVCAVGFSYGGYAATMLTIKHPNVYKCAGNIAGVSDVNLYLASTRLNKNQKEWVKEYIGDREADYDNIKQISPTYLTEKITRPIFIAHGKKDSIVDVEHAFRLTLMMKRNKKKFDFYLDEESGHHFSEPEKSILLHEKILEFVNLNI